MNRVKIILRIAQAQAFHTLCISALRDAGTNKNKYTPSNREALFRLNRRLLVFPHRIQQAQFREADRRKKSKRKLKPVTIPFTLEPWEAEALITAHKFDIGSYESIIINQINEQWQQLRIG